MVIAKAIRGELVVPSCDPTALLDLVEEAFDEVTRSMEVWTEADRLVAIAFRRDVGPGSLVDGEFSDPVGVVATIGKQHRSPLQARQEPACKPIVVGLTGRQRRPDGQAIVSTTAWILLVNPPRDRPMDCLPFRVMHAPC
jgi:hypothetical protein